MDETTQLALLWRLVGATDAGLLEWYKVEDSEYSFIAWTPKWAYGVKSRDGDDQGPYNFLLYRVESPNDGPRKGALLDQWNTRDYDSLFDPTEALYQAVKRKVMGYDSLVAEMFADLAAIDGGSPTPPSDASKPEPVADPWASVQTGEPPF